MASTYNYGRKSVPSIPSAIYIHKTTVGRDGFITATRSAAAQMVKMRGRLRDDGRRAVRYNYTCP